jgi:hypothetical protein
MPYSPALDPQNLSAQWSHAQVRHIIAPAIAGVVVSPETMRGLLSALPRDQLQAAAEGLWHHLSALNEKMLSKKEVARLAGMTVSWLNNSLCEKAIKLRATGIRYGTQQNAPVRYPRGIVTRICRENEAGRA